MAPLKAISTQMKLLKSQKQKVTVPTVAWLTMSPLEIRITTLQSSLHHT